MPEPFTPPTITPGAYLKHRRQAALLAPADVAARIATEPRVGLHLLAEQIELIEVDVQPANFSTIVALNRVFAFDLGVLARLVAIAMGYDYPPPHLCRICSCSEHDPCRLGSAGEFGRFPCRWIELDLCSRCASPTEAMAA